MPTPEARFTWDNDPAQYEPFVVCAECGEKLCTIEEDDTFTVIVSVVHGHYDENHPDNTDRKD